MRIFNNKYYHPPVYAGEVNSEPSMTVPDQTMSLRTILDRHARGLPITGVNEQPTYNEDAEGIDLKSLDLSEAHDLIAAKTAELNETLARIEQSKQEKKKRDEEQAKKRDEELSELRKLKQEFETKQSTNQS